MSEQRLTMRENLEQAKEFFGGFSGDHRTFVSWNKDFLQKERKKLRKKPKRGWWETWGGQVTTMGRHQATIVHLWQDLDSFLKIICVKSVITGSKMKQRWRKAKQMQPMWLCIFSGKQFEETFDKAQWRKSQTNATNACDYASSDASNLRAHLKTHSGEKPSKCNQCDYVSSKADNLKRHLKTHSGGS